MRQHSEQAELKEDPVSISIDEMLKSLPQTSIKFEPSISKVPNYVRQVNEKAYEPLVIAIGPYHRGKDHLKALEDQKIRVFQMLLEERKENNVSEYVKKMRELEERARKCYAEPVTLDSDDFVKILLLDGCFLVQLIRLYLNKVPKYLKDLVDCYSASLFGALMQDVLLVENQLPFFVLWELFGMIESTADQDIFKEAIFDMLYKRVPGKERPKDDLKSSILEIKHLLHFTHQYCCHPSTSEMEASEETEEIDFKGFNFMRCATELQEAGIKFKTAEGDSMFHIRFENGTLHIPKINFEDYTESFLRNLIAFEQLFVADEDLKHASDYMVFMDYLIDSPKDVEILCQHGIIINMLGEDKAVATMINSLGLFISYSSNFYYNEVFNKVNKHCSKRWNKRMANLKHNYFNSPWALLSVLAAALLLLLTVLQTVFSVLSYAK